MKDKKSQNNFHSQEKPECRLYRNLKKKNKGKNNKDSQNAKNDDKEVKISQNYFINQININNLRDKIAKSHQNSSVLSQLLDKNLKETKIFKSKRSASLNKSKRPKSRIKKNRNPNSNKLNKTSLSANRSTSRMKSLKSQSSINHKKLSSLFEKIDCKPFY